VHRYEHPSLLDVWAAVVATCAGIYPSKKMGVTIQFES